MALIGAIAELERIGWGPIVPVSGDEVKTRCPFHDDTDPSCTLNTEKLVFNCKACPATGDFVSFMARALNVDRATYFVDVSKRYDLEQVKAIEPSVIEADHRAIWAQKHMLQELYSRGMTDQDIRQYRIGFNERFGRITIPVKNDGGVYVNVRYYMPGATKIEKMKNARGRGAIRIFMIEQLSKYSKMIIAGGEVKSIVTAKVTNPHGIGVCCATAGEGKWHHSFTDRFRGKEKVWIMQDVDAAGKKASQVLAALIRPVVPWVGIVELPLDTDKYPKGDVNDFIAKENGDLMKVLEDVPEWFPSFEAPQVDDSEEPVERKFSEVIRSENVGRRMHFNAVVSAAVDKPFVVPKRILVDCDKSFEGCSVCAVFRTDQKLFHVSAESPAILQMVDVPTERLDMAIRAALSIPRRCDKVTFNVEEHYNAWDARVNPSLEISNRDSDKTMQQAICVACDADLNTTYKFTGRMYPHPRTQSATLLLSKSETAHDALSKYEPRDLPALRVFRPAEWTLEALSERLDDIYSDLETNVTKIFKRRDIHLFVDLAYHSPLLLSLDGKTTKGWVEVLIVGDSSQGKSEATMSLMRHYQLGEKVDCKNATPAGLLGGLKQMGTQWFVAWGVIPTHDRRIVVLEELKGAPVETIAHLTDMRSSGIAETAKIEKRRTHARTRLVGLSNCRDDRHVASYAFGVEAIRDLIGAPEDVRRFDAALIVASSEVNPRELNALVRDPPQVQHRYTSDLCRDLILWSWTRKHDEIEFTEETQECIAEEAGKLTDAYTDVIPLIDRGSTRYKLARLSAALACRTFSTGETELHARVHLCHVQYVANTLHRVYSSQVFGYKYYSEAVRASDRVLDTASVKTFLMSMTDPNEAVRQILYADTVDLADVCDMCAIDRDQAQQFLSLVVRKRCMRRVEKRYVKTPAFIEFLKDLQEKRIEDPPEHLMNDQGRY